MDEERQNLLKLLFPNGIPADWEYSAYFNDYISKVGTFKVEDLSKEPSRLREEKSNILERTQELAVTNYKTFVQTVECSRELFQQFNNIETKLDELLADIPKFEGECQKFASETSEINNLRRLNSLALTRNAQLLEILELPQLMDSFIKDGLYEDALELTAYVRRLYGKNADIPIFKGIVDDVEKSWSVMLNQLLGQLRDDISLPKCLQIVGHLRHMEVFNEAELRLKFLQARSSWFKNCLRNIPSDDATYHLNKTIEVTRVNLFNIITQYRAIFNDDEHSPLASVKNQNVNQNLIFFSWIRDQITEFLSTLQKDLNRGVTSLDSVLGQCMYFGMSFSRVGCDFRALAAPIFAEKITANFELAIAAAANNFERDIERYTLINKNHSGVPYKKKSDEKNQPPESLLEFYPLAEYLNNVLGGFNELRLCSPVSALVRVTECLRESLTRVARAILNFYGQEQQAFTPVSKDAFTRLCICFADDLVPFVQKCVHVVFPPGAVSAHAGVNVQLLQREGLSFLDKGLIVGPIRHLLPVTVEPAFAKADYVSERVDSDGVEVTDDLHAAAVE